MAHPILKNIHLSCIQELNAPSGAILRAASASRTTSSWERARTATSRGSSFPTDRTGGRMRGDDKVITLLNDVLTAELTAVNQYFIHAMMCRNWHYKRLAEHSRTESIAEMKHAQELIERILSLGESRTCSAT